MLQKNNIIIEMFEEPGTREIHLRGKVGLVAGHKFKPYHLRSMESVQKEGMAAIIGKLLTAIYGDLVHKTKEEFLKELYAMGMPREQKQNGSLDKKVIKLTDE